MSPLTMSQALRDRGLKLTQARHAVLQVLGEASEHLRVTEVHRRARRIAPGIGLASVYRTMELLARLNLIRPVHMEHRHRHYARIDKAHGHHLVCNGCGLVVEFSDCRVDRLARSLARRTRFLIDDHSVELYGRCPTCRG
ncbi:MAG TPA: Fur family transcriptional regulator [Candidatus Acidoferrum sp.]|nr:Fur family transcriptional regulator [Candidatus Acidoferrum sp.]